MRITAIVGAACLPLALITAPAAAQTAGDSGTEDYAALTEVVVTARKTEENLQRASIAVSAITPDIIARSGIKDPTDLQSRLPAVEFQSATSVPTVSIRGIGSYNLQAGVDPAVAYSIDGIYLARPQAYPPVLVDIAQVEAVRGPQGTLYGRNSNGGALSFLTNKPVLGRLDASAALSSGNYDAVGTEAMINAPLGDKAALRAAFGSDRHDGFYKDGYNDARNFAGRVRLLAEPTDNLQLIASFDKSRIKNDGLAYEDCPPRSAYPACDNVPWRPYSGLDGRDPGDFTLIDTWAAYGEANLTLDWGTVTALAGYRHNDWSTRQTLMQSGTSVGFVQGQLSKFLTEEFRIASPSDSAVKWMVGGYGSRETGSSSEAFLFAGTPYFSSYPQLRATSKAVFGQVTVPVTDTFRVTSGLRYTDEKKSADGLISVIQATTTVLPLDSSTRLNRVTWKAGVDIDVAPQSLLYATASSGFKSGGINQVPNTSAFARSYQPEFITAYQIGSKNRFLSNRLQVNAEAFYYDYKGFQTLQAQVDPLGMVPGFFLQTVNSQKATIYGGEVELEFALSPKDRITAAPTVLHARFDRFLVNGVDLSGNEIQGAPDYSLALSYEHTFDLSAGAHLIAAVDSKLVDANFVDSTNAPGSYQPSYTRSGASLTFESGQRGWTITAFVRNIEDGARLMTYAPPLLAAGDYVQLYPPRTYGMTVKWRL